MWGNVVVAMRRRRIRVKGVVGHYHCMSRVCGAEFLLGEEEKDMLARMIRKVAEFCGVEVLTWCVMSNHFHVLVRVPADQSGVDDETLISRYRALYGEASNLFQPSAEVLETLLRENGRDGVAWRKCLLGRMHDISAYMKMVKQRFSIWYNHRHTRIGTLWSERFKSVLVEGSVRALSTVAAYIDLNPVRAGLVEDPGSYRWSGYGVAIGGDSPAQAGIGRVYALPSSEWKRTRRNYELVLFGRSGSSAPEDAKTTRAGALGALERGATVARTELLRCRLRFLTDGGVLGSKEFIAATNPVVAQSPKPSRPIRPRDLPGEDWGGLMVSSRLRGPAIF